MLATKSKNSKKTAFIIISVLMPAILTTVIMCSYGMVKEYVSSHYENLYESEGFVKELLKGNYLLYKNLCEKVTGESVQYADLYIRDMRALLGEDAEYSEDVLADAREEFNDTMEGELSSHFSGFNNLDYYAEDLETGISVSNTISEQPLNEDDYAYFLEIVYNENGSAVIKNAKSDNTERLLKNVSAYTLTKNLLLQNWMGSYGVDFLRYGDSPKNCRIVYGMTNPGYDALHDGVGSYLTERSTYHTYMDSGIMGYIAIAYFILLFLALLLPFGKLREKPFSESRFFNLPVELLAAIGILSSIFASEILNNIILLLDGSAAKGFVSFLGISEMAAGKLAVLTHWLFLFAIFASAWYIGLALRPLIEKKPKRYIMENCILYRIFPFCKKKILKLYDSLEHIDVTKKAGKTILKIVLINAAVLFLISSLWFGGFMVTVVYSVILYFGLKFYVSRMQKKYTILLGKIEEISAGNLNVEIREDLGIFEPFKEQLLLIQTGFRNAVEEEVKSQKMKSELITNVSHDLKTPLTAIITYVDLLKDETLSDAQRQEYLDTLEKKSLRLKVLIEDLFEVSKATSGNATLHYMDVDICNLVKQVELEMSDKLEEAGLDVRMDLPQEKVIVSLDSQKTYRIYENLFQNIAKYSLKGTRVYVQGTLTQDRIMISLKNISASELTVDASRLTERFVRGDVSRNTEGSGLGLAIVKSFVELQGGKFVLESDGDLFKAVTSFPLKR